MRWILLLSVSMWSALSFGSVRLLDKDNVTLGQFAQIQAGTGVRAAQSYGRGYMYVNPVAQQSYAGGTLGLGHCGQTIVAGLASSVVLPVASTVLGCQYKIVVGGAFNVDVNPGNATDQILLLTNAAGDQIRGSALGAAVILEAVRAGASYFWVPTGGMSFTQYSDNN